MRPFVDVVGVEAPHRPARLFPHCLLARVLANVQVKRPAVDLEDQALLAPAEVCLFAGDSLIELWHRPLSVSEDLKCTNLCAASSAFER